MYAAPLRLETSLSFRAYVDRYIQYCYPGILSPLGYDKMALANKHQKRWRGSIPEKGQLLVATQPPHLVAR